MDEGADWPHPRARRPRDEARAGQPAQAVMQALVGEVRVHGRDHIVPTFYVPEDPDPAKVLCRME